MGFELFVWSVIASGVGTVVYKSVRGLFRSYEFDELEKLHQKNNEKEFRSYINKLIEDDEILKNKLIEIQKNDGNIFKKSKFKLDNSSKFDIDIEENGQTIKSIGEDSDWTATNGSSVNFKVKISK